MSQHGHLIEPIDRLLCHSTTGLFRKEIFNRLGDEHGIGIEDIQLVSLAVQELEKAGHIRKGSRESTKGFRWEATPQGRAYYSELNSDPETGDKSSDECDRAKRLAEKMFGTKGGIVKGPPDLLDPLEHKTTVTIETADHGEIDDKLDLLAAKDDIKNDLNKFAWRTE